MTDRARQIAEMVDMLPEQDQALAFELVRKLVLAWNPDFTKLTAKERAELEEAENDPEIVPMDAIN